MNDASPGGLGKVVAKSVGWTVVRITSDQLALFLIFAMLTRLLPPSAFGAISIAVIFVEVSKLVASNGIAEAVLQSSEVTDVVADTAFWLNLALSAVMAVLMIASAPLLGAAMHSAELPAIITVLAATPIIAAGGAIHTSRILRQFGYRAIAMRSFAANIIGGIAAVAMAYAGYGLWALVVQRLIVEAILTVSSWIAFRWRPGLTLSIEQSKKLCLYGVHVSTTGIIFLLSSRVHELIMGVTIGLAAVGILRVGFRLTELITQFAVRPFSTVASPTFRQLREDPAALRAGYLRLQAVCAALAFPAFIGTGALCLQIVPIVFGKVWQPSAEIVQILTFMVVPIVLNYFVTPALYATGRPSGAVRVALVQLVLGTIACLIAAPFGVFWVAIAYVVRAYITMPYVLFELKRATGLRPADSLRGLAAPFAAATIMGGIVLLVADRLQSVASPLPIALVGMAVGLLVYPALLALLSPRLLEEARNMLGGFRTRFAAR